MNAYKHVLAAVETSAREANFVASRAAELAKAAGATLGLIHVVEPREFELASRPVEDIILQHAREALEHAAKELNPKPKITVAVGSVRYEISQAAEQEKADIIVIGSHGRHGVGRLLGSTASAVVHSIPCDVLVIRMPSRA